MIQKLEQYVIGANYGCGGASFSEVIDKVNEVIDYINSQPEETNGAASTMAPACWGEEQGEVELVNDLEEAAKEYASKTLCDPDDGPSVGLVKDSFIAGAEWMRKKDVEDMYMSDNRHFLKCYEQGKVDMKVEMMKDAEEDALLLERAWLTLDGFGHEELAGRLRQFAERKGLIWK